MKLRDYREDLLERLKDPEYAAGYLEAVLADGDSTAFLIALKDVIDARGGVSDLAKRARMTRPGLYKILSKEGNPTLQTLRQVLKPIGLRISIALDEAA
jgi:probable addiction module antidote protein